MPEVSVAPPEFQNVLSAREQLAQMPQEQRAVKFLEGAKDYITKKHKEGTFTTSDDEQAATQVEAYKGGADAQGLRAVFTALDALKGDEIADGLSEGITQSGARVLVNEDGATKTLTHEQWQERLNACKTPEERAELEGKGSYEFVQQEQKTSQPIEAQLTLYRTQLEYRIKQKKPEQVTPGERQLLAHLMLAENARGEVGVLLRTKAVSELLKTDTSEEWKKLYADLREQVPTAQQKLRDHLTANGVLEKDMNTILQAAENMNIDTLLQHGLLEKVKGIDVLVFGRAMTQKEAEGLLYEHMTPEQKADLLKKYGKKAGLGLLILLLVSATQIFSAGNPLKQ